MIEISRHVRKQRLTDDEQIRLRIAVLQALLDVYIPENVGAIETNALADEFVATVDLSLRASAGDEPF